MAQDPQATAHTTRLNAAAAQTSRTHVGTEALAMRGEMVFAQPTTDPITLGVRRDFAYSRRAVSPSRYRDVVHQEAVRGLAR